MVDAIKDTASTVTSKLQDMTGLSSKNDSPPRIVPKANGKAKIVFVSYDGKDAVKRNPEIVAANEKALGLREWLQEKGYDAELIITSDKDGDSSEFMKHVVDCDVIVTSPFWPAYLQKEQMQKAKKLKLSITAGIGSDHNDLQYAEEHGITVMECTGSNSISVAEHAVMQILASVRNYDEGHKQVLNGTWDVAAVAERAWDIQGMHIGSVAVGRIGEAILRRLQPFDVHLHYASVSGHRHKDVEEKLNMQFHESVEDMVKVCDVVTINCPLTKDSRELFDEKMLRSMKKGAFLVNTARAEIINKEALVKVMNDGHLGGYTGDTWYPEPAPADHPWRKLAHNTLTIHCSGHTIQAQRRIAEQTKEMLTAYFEGKPQNSSYIMA